MKNALLPLLLGLLVGCLAVATRVALADPAPPIASVAAPATATAPASPSATASHPGMSGCTEVRVHEPSLLAPETLGPLLGVPTTFFTILAIVVASLVYRFRRDKQRLDTVRFLAEKGQDIPVELLVARAKSTSIGTLKAGLVLLLGGAGLSISLLLAHVTDAAGFGLIPGFIGLAYLIVWRVDRAQAGKGPGAARGGVGA
jgi:hypothetical protein